MAKPATNAPVVPPAATPAAQPVSPTLVVVVPANYKLPKANSARGKWLAALQAHNGQTAAAFTAHVLANPPSTPTKGKLAGQCEPPAGWLGYFVRQGILTYKAQAK